jgi:hypothetical protein
MSCNAISFGPLPVCLVLLHALPAAWDRRGRAMSSSPDLPLVAVTAANAPLPPAASKGTYEERFEELEQSKIDALVKVKEASLVRDDACVRLTRPMDVVLVSTAPSMRRSRSRPAADITTALSHPNGSIARTRLRAEFCVFVVTYFTHQAVARCELSIAKVRAAAMFARDSGDESAKGQATLKQLDSQLEVLRCDLKVGVGGRAW